MNRRKFGFLTLAATALLAGCTGVGQMGSAGLGGPPLRAEGVLDVARANGSTAFLRAIKTAGLEEQLTGDGPYTLFVPTDAAFRAAGVSTSGNSETLRRILGYHVVPGQVGSSFMRGMEVNHLTSTGETLSIDGSGETIRVNDARVLREDLQARNGVVHLIDRVLQEG